jgi:hypothetical protein
VLWWAWPRAACRCAAFPDVLVWLDQDPARPPRQRRARRADHRPHHAGDRPVLPGDERLHRAGIAAALGDGRRLALSDAHAQLYRAGDCTRGQTTRQADERNYTNDTTLAQMLSHIDLLGLPATITLDGPRGGLTRFGQQR